MGQRNCLGGDALGRMVRNVKEETGALLAAGFHLPSTLLGGREQGAVAQSALVLGQNALAPPKGKACCSHGALTGPRRPGPGTDFCLRPPQLVTSCIPRARPWEVFGGRDQPAWGTRTLAQGWPPPALTPACPGLLPSSAIIAASYDTICNRFSASAPKCLLQRKNAL